MENEKLFKKITEKADEYTSEGGSEISRVSCQKGFLGGIEELGFILKDDPVYKKLGESLSRFKDYYRRNTKVDPIEK